MSESKADWLNMPDLEEKIGQAEKLPPDLDRVTACVGWIAEALDKKVKIEPWSNSLGPAVTFRLDNHNQSVRVLEGRYFIAHSVMGDRYETEETSTSHLAWTLAGFPFTPSAARARLKKAKELGISYPPGVVPLGMPRAKPQAEAVGVPCRDGKGLSKYNRLSGVPIGIGIGVAVEAATHSLIFACVTGAVIGVAVNAGMQQWNKHHA